MTDRSIYALSDVARSVESIIHKTYSKSYWIKAEIARLNFYPKSGHCYPELVEKKEGKIIAQMRAMIFSDKYNASSKRFEKETGMKLDNGITILFKAQIDFHPIHGLSLNILDIDPSYTLGEMAREKQEVVQKLKQEGVFFDNKKKSLPLLPGRLAIISVETSKGFHDFKSIIDKSRYRFSYHLFPAVLQGDNAIHSIRTKLFEIKQLSGEFDVVLIMRGGGGDIGLNCYDNFSLARDVALCSLPVITGIGHSINETVTDMVAFLKKITPTEVAYFLIEKFDAFESNLNKTCARLEQRISSLLDKEKIVLWNTTRGLQAGVDSFKQEYSQRVTGSADKICYLVPSYFDSTKGLLRNVESSLTSKVVYTIESSRTNLAVTEKVLQLLDPQNVLQRGYTITFHKGKTVKNANKLKKGEKIITQFYDGLIESEITAKE